MIIQGLSTGSELSLISGDLKIPPWFHSQSGELVVVMRYSFIPRVGDCSTGGSMVTSSASDVWLEELHLAAG